MGVESSCGTIGGASGMDGVTCGIHVVGVSCIVGSITVNSLADRINKVLS